MHITCLVPFKDTFNGPFSGSTQVSRYQKRKTNLDFTEARDSEWQWHQLGHMQVCTLLQTDDHASTSPLTGRMPFLPPNQQRQSTEGICKSAPRSRQITTPAAHHSVFYRLDALPDAQPTAPKH